MNKTQLTQGTYQIQAKFTKQQKDDIMKFSALDIEKNLTDQLDELMAEIKREERTKKIDTLLNDG